MRICDWNINIFVLKDKRLKQGDRFMCNCLCLFAEIVMPLLSAWGGHRKYFFFFILSDGFFHSLVTWESAPPRVSSGTLLDRTLSQWVMAVVRVREHKSTLTAFYNLCVRFYLECQVKHCMSLKFPKQWTHAVQIVLRCCNFSLKIQKAKLITAMYLKTQALAGGF